MYVFRASGESDMTNTLTTSSRYMHTKLPITDNDMTTCVNTIQTPLNCESSSEDGVRLRWRMKTPFGAHLYTLIFLSYRQSGPCAMPPGLGHSG